MLRMLHYKGDIRRTFARGEGCRDCFDTGFQGRHGIYELLPAESQLRSLVARQASLEEVERYCREQKLPTLLQGGLELAKREMTSLDEVARVAMFE